MAAMSNLYPPWEGQPEGDRPTEQFWRPGAPATPPSGPAPSVPAWQQQPGSAPPKPHRHKALGWAAGLTLAALLAGGGTAAAMTLAGRSAGTQAPNAAGAPGTATGGRSQAALLNATLSSASAPGALVTAPQASGPAAPAAGTAHPCLRARWAARAARRAGLPRVARAARLAGGHCRAIRRRVFRFFLLRGVDGQFTIRTAAGLKTIAFQRGTVESVSQGTSIQVKASDGTSWTWHLVSSTVVRDWGGKLGASSLSDGEPVWVGGRLTGGNRDARLIVVRPPAPASGS
jgi:hypothetical protein